MRFATTIVALFGTATVVALVARRLKTPYTVALVVAGLALGAVHLLPAPHLTQELLYAAFLPGLVFEAAFHLDARSFWRNKRAIVALAVPGVVLSIAVTAAVLTGASRVLRFEDGFAAPQALVFAALISATDPIAVVALFRSLGVPKRLAVLVEGESLVNDGTAVVLFGIAVSFATGGDVTVSGALVTFATVAGAGLGIGLAIGYGISKVVERIDEPLIEITLTTIAAYGAFAAAEQAHASGIIATLASGMCCGSYGARRAMSPTTRIAVGSFWEYVAFALNSVVFLLIGLEVQLARLFASWQAILVAWVAVTAGRAAVVFSVQIALHRTAERIPTAWSGVLTWGGLRGALSMVLALALPAGFAGRDEVVTVTFGVVLLSILVQGVTMAPLLRRLGIAGGAPDREELEERRGAALAGEAALEALATIRKEHAVPADVVAKLEADYRARVDEAERSLGALYAEHAAANGDATCAARRYLLQVEKDRLLEAYHRGTIGRRVYERLTREVDAKLVKVEDDEEE